MKIDRVNNIYDKYLENSIRKENKPVRNREAQDAVRVQISDEAKALVERINEAKDEGFSQRVERIRQAVLSGSYQLFTENIAERILEVIEDQEGSELDEIL